MKSAPNAAQRVVMITGTRAEAVEKLEKARGELQALGRATEGEMVVLARTFEALTSSTDAVLDLAATIVSSVENEAVCSALPKVRTLGAAAKRFVGEKVQATHGILETVTQEVHLLYELSVVSRSQRAIALQTRALSVLTNMEVARLGDAGTGFRYLAQELADFATSVTKDIQELADHTEARRAAIEETRQVLSTELPHLQDELARIESGLESALTVVDSSLTQLLTMPVQFKKSVQDIAQQIAGVVAAVQAHDITRQQIEHVEGALAAISSRLSGEGNSQEGIAQELPRAYAGLTIQIHQGRTIRQTVSSWVSQIRTCMDAIRRISASEVVGIAPAVLEQEQHISSHLSRIELLESESRAYSEKLQQSLGGLSHLMQLVTEHLQRTKSVRERLQLLAFNSIIEASRLGVQAAAVLAIAKRIEAISTSWSQITDQSARTMQEMLKLAEQTNQVMEAFSERSNQRLREAQLETRGGLDSLRSAAAFAAGQAEKMKLATEKMQAKIVKAGSTGDLLDACSGRFDLVLAEMEAVHRQLEIDDPQVKQRYDAAEIERLFSASYTTATEREVLQAALHGTPPPVVQQSFEGNSVELF